MSRDNPWIMRRLHGWGPKAKTCEECIFYREDDPEENGVCTHEEVPHDDFIVNPGFRACGLFKSHWQADRELLERLGQKCIDFATRGG